MRIASGPRTCCASTSWRAGWTARSSTSAARRCGRRARTRSSPLALRELPAQPAPPAPDTSAATTSLILGLVGITLLVFSVGFLSLLTLPISATALVMGRRAHRRKLGPAAKAGMWLGVAGTALSVLWLSGLAALFYL